jgi:hypothetical protein
MHQVETWSNKNWKYVILVLKWEMMKNLFLEDWKVETQVMQWCDIWDENLCNNMELIALGTDVRNRILVMLAGYYDWI